MPDIDYCVSCGLPVLSAEEVCHCPGAASAIPSTAWLDAFDRIRDAAVKAFAVSRHSARRDPIGRAQAEREFDILFGVIQDEKHKSSNDQAQLRSEAE